MIAAHITLAIFCGALAAGVVWFAFGGLTWWMLLAYCGVGSAACLVSATVAMVIAAICPGRPENLTEKSQRDVPDPSGWSERWNSRDASRVDGLQL